MANLDENRTHWRAYDWRERGDEWSRPWGSADSQWRATILPRIRRFVPCDRILELGCGYGRWAQYLKDYCRELVVVDQSEECVEACKRRFHASPQIRYAVTDGMSLVGPADGTVDLVFSFDSLVHADARVIGSYLADVSRILSPNGALFLHHSNLGEYREQHGHIATYPRLRRALIRLGVLDDYLHWRDPNVSADLVRTVARQQGLSCILQEIIHWRTRCAMIDCFSTIVPSGSALAGTTRVIRNRLFMSEVRQAYVLWHLYAKEPAAGSIGERPPGTHPAST